MPLTEPSARRLRPVRLTDVPLEQRIAAAHQALKGCKDGDEAQALLAAALTPSDKVYFVTPDALTRLAA
jgi:hypothetical protein